MGVTSDSAHDLGFTIVVMSNETPVYFHQGQWRSECNELYMSSTHCSGSFWDHPAFMLSCVKLFSYFLSGYLH
jgi:hypothetical protein